MINEIDKIENKRNTAKTSEVLELIKMRLSCLKISSKFVVFYFFLLTFSISLSNILFQNINSRLLKRKISDIAVQTLHTISSSIDSTLHNLSNHSKMILADQHIQKALTQNGLYFDVGVSNNINKSLYLYLQAMPTISSIYILDNYGTIYSADRKYVRELKLESILDAEWYNEVVEKRGSFILKNNVSHIFEDNSEEKYISFIRLINDIHTDRGIGVLIMNIPTDILGEAYKKVIDENDTDIAILDSNNSVIIGFNNLSMDNIQSLLPSANEKDSNGVIRKINGVAHLVSHIESQENNWKFISVIPFNRISSEFRIFSIIAFFVIILNSYFLLIGSIFLSKLVITPINKVLESMKRVEIGEFAEVNINTNKDEIGMLIDGYNSMIYRIKNLFIEVIEEQKVKRKVELCRLQEQIKPHFLYNSLDAIAYFTLSENREEAYEAIMALSNYYRTSLSKGNEVITIAEEIEIVKNYLIIQKVRFPNMFEDYYNLDDRVGNIKILKMVLQPLVENALFHGIRPKAEKGSIKITSQTEGDFIRLSVEDNGVGMNEKEFSKLIGAKLEHNACSFGLRGTIERLKIFYDAEDIYCIRSEKGLGTKITLNIPVKRRNESGQGFDQSDGCG
jgi:two-component system, sensor histidine kinase YesM